MAAAPAAAATAGAATATATAAAAAPANQKTAEAADPKAVEDANVKKWSATEKKAIDTLIGAADHVKGWEFYSKTEGEEGITVHTWTNPDGTTGVTGQGIVLASPARVLAEVSNEQNWKSWDSLLNGFSIKAMAPRYRLVRLMMWSMWPISPRDVTYFETKHTAADGSIMLATTSVEDPTFPVDPDHVRATLLGGGWHCRPVKDQPNQTLVTYFMNTDPKLSFVPSWVMNLATVRFPGIINVVRKAIAEKDAAAAAKAKSTATAAAPAAK